MRLIQHLALNPSYVRALGLRCTDTKCHTLRLDSPTRLYGGWEDDTKCHTLRMDTPTRLDEKRMLGLLTFVCLWCRVLGHASRKCLTNHIFRFESLKKTFKQLKHLNFKKHLKLESLLHLKQILCNVAKRMSKQLVWCSKNLKGQ